MTMDRRSFLGASALAALAAPPAARAQPMTAPEPALPFDAIESIPMWPGEPPGNTGTALTLHVWDDTPPTSSYHNRFADGIARPALFVFRAPGPDGSAVLIFPGGGYRDLQVDNEGIDVAKRFNAAGVTAFVLLYRLPDEGWINAADVPLQDAQRALRLIRFNAAHFGIDEQRLGVIGFSAGGHLAASLATRYDAKVYSAGDAADMLSARPQFMALLYPVITMLPPYAHEASREMLLGEHPTTAERAAYSCEKHVTADAPPAFLCAAGDDPDVPIENTLEMFAALRAKHVPVEMHLFERGGHGFGVHGQPELPVADWPQLFLNWGQSRGYFKGAPIKS